jgi:hypothetical protein
LYKRAISLVGAAFLVAVLGVPASTAAADPASESTPPASLDLPLETKDPLAGNPAAQENPDGEPVVDGGHKPGVIDPVELEDRRNTPPGRANPDCGKWFVTAKKKWPLRVAKASEYIVGYYGGSGGSLQLTSGESGETAFTGSISLGGTLGFKSIVEANATFGIEYAEKKTTSVSRSSSVSVPANRWGQAFWGNLHVPVSFESEFLRGSDCKVTSKKVYTTYGPYQDTHSAWCSWVSKEAMTSRPARCTVGPYLKP